MSDFSKKQTEELFARFETEGLISEKEIALCFMLKSKKRAAANKKFNGFVLHCDETPQLYQNVKKMMENKKTFEFQFAYKEYGEADVADGHWTSGMIRFDTQENTLKVLLCDPIGGKSIWFLKKTLEGHGFEFNEISKSHAVEVYLSTDYLQWSSMGCSYLAIDNCFMLSTQSDYEDVFEFMKKNDLNPTREKNHITFSSTLPTRLKRQLQSLTELQDSVLSDEQSASKIVNKKKQTMTASVEAFKREELVQNKVSIGYTKKIRNSRMAIKRENLKRDIERAFEEEFSSSGKGSSLLEKAVEMHRLPGLNAFTQNVLTSPEVISPVESEPNASSTLKPESNFPLSQKSKVNEQTDVDEFGKPSSLHKKRRKK